MQSMQQMMVGLAADDEYFATKVPAAPARDESLYGGKYHGPSNEAGLTVNEYWEMMEEWRDEQARLRDEW